MLRDLDADVGLGASVPLGQCPAVEPDAQA